LILEDEVFHDASFKQSLCDAVESLAVGSAWELETRVGPLIRPPRGVLDTALKELEPGESWAVMPHPNEDNPHLYSPAVKWDVQPGSFTHMTEFFGPVLGVMRARDIYHAIELVNQTGYGLTSGLESLDEREQEIWLAGVRAGNLYVNRGTTGAIVLRQPFGGMGKSAFGPGIQAGGPNYVAPLTRFAEVNWPDDSDRVADPSLAALTTSLIGLADRDDARFPRADIDRLAIAAASYDRAVRNEFGQEHDHFHLIGQDNIRRYLPVRELRIRVSAQDTCYEILARVCAGKVVGCRSTLSFPVSYDEQFIAELNDVTHEWAGALELVEESDEELATAIREGHTHCVRYAARDRVPLIVRTAAAATGVYIVDEPVLANGRIELLWYVEEQSISNNYHRYGNLGARATEPRAETL
jgi:RHH-type proline utilization regulon transcriptional repressor/proline dehydrogenase/delta 1-pyrroline-5-carboxylate dehydrogenase